MTFPLVQCERDLLPTFAIRPKEDLSHPARSATYAYLLDWKKHPDENSGILVYGRSFVFNATEPWKMVPGEEQISENFSCIDAPYVFGPEVAIMGWTTTKCIWTDYELDLDFGVYSDTD